MIRRCLQSQYKMYGKKLFYPRYGNSFYESSDYARVLGSARPEINDKYECEKEQWTSPGEQVEGGGSEVNVNNPQVRQV